MRRWYEVRTRCWIGPNQSIKKSKFYEASSCQEAASHYNGPGTIMSVTKVSKEQALGIGDFFKLGNILLEDLKQNRGR